MKKIVSKEQLQTHKRKLLLLGLAVLILSITAVGYISTRNQIFIEDGKETFEVQTREETVEEVLLEAEVDYIEEDIITPSLNTSVKDKMAIQIVRAQNIEIADEDKVHTLLTPVITVGDALVEARILIRPDDKVSPSVDTPLEEGIKIKITRAIPCDIVVGGEEIKLKTINETVGEVLAEGEVELGDEDLINYELNDPVTEDMTIEIIRVEKEVIIETEEIDFQTQRQNDGDLNKGKTRVEREGQKGAKEKEIEVTYEDGEEVNRETISEEVIKKPVDRVVKIGTKEPKPASTVQRGGSWGSSNSNQDAPSQNSNYRTLTVEATAYTSQDPGVGTITATGARLRHGIIAVDPRVIALGTKIYVPGYGYGVAADTGGAIKGNKIDLAYEYRSDALRFGRRTMTIRIYD